MATDSYFEDIPVDVQSYLTEDEDIEIIADIREGELYVTNKRVILRKGGFSKEIIEASYRHISSIKYKLRRSRKWLILGVICLAIGVLALNGWILLPIYISSIELVLFLILFVVGGIGIIRGMLGREQYTFHIIGRDPIVLSAHNIEDIVKIVRQYREKVEL
ncbi:MAG: hypothetical protein NWE83_06620 [Candidatus Bathyarchaeota archaeon]|nr:hypothetical protein [Candidatus Bathyarchaeota archaeon]